MEHIESANLEEIVEKDKRLIEKALLMSLNFS